MESQLTRQMIETKYGRIFQGENGLVYFYMRDNMSVSGADAKQMVRDVCSLDESGKVRLVIVPGANKDLSFEAQRYFSIAPGFSRMALVIENRVQAEIGQFLVAMMRLLHSPYELKLFHELHKAEAWLLS
ncbi:MAG: STAS/SEC14 domain-containing protein [Ardenticatenaceae bacterium]|nr:STAS/SEC14 domain-containing protein [Anaerolineales bacterium]MCB9009756.1 STAS/SEC14 domain-containing protein [Ardenticatenaceae bacterium]